MRYRHIPSSIASKYEQEEFVEGTYFVKSMEVKMFGFWVYKVRLRVRASWWRSLQQLASDDRGVMTVSVMTVESTLTNRVFC
jgi:hypothetical protein